MSWKESHPRGDGMIGLTWVGNARPAPTTSETTASLFARAPELEEGIVGHYAPDGEVVMYPEDPSDTKGAIGYGRVAVARTPDGWPVTNDPAAKS